MDDRVAILLATYNGQCFIRDQIASISSQSFVLPFIYLSDDQSSDDTLECATHACSDFGLPYHIVRSERDHVIRDKSAANNFYHLICKADLPREFEWIAFSDQDDLWLPDHLTRGIQILRKDLTIGGYSSDVIAFWPGGHKRYVKKHAKIGKYNHLFESPGPGCTFILPRRVFDQVRSKLVSNLRVASRVEFHDWLVYACVRSLGYRWFIDPVPSLLYRQHPNNVIGVKLDPASIVKRCSMLFGAWYKSQCLAIAAFCGQESVWPVIMLGRLSFLDRITLLLFAPLLRRRLRDQLVLALALLIMPPRVSREETN